jgi:hypothetical protein
MASAAEPAAAPPVRFDPAEAIPVLRATPAVLRALLAEIPPAWIMTAEGPGTWAAFDIIGHLIHGERTDWIARAELILAHGETRTFDVFHREAMFEASRGQALGDLLGQFAELRAANLARLEAMRLTPEDLERRGRHPELGAVTLGQHLATWVAHDLSHIAQIARVMGKRYGEAVGPWRAYLPMLQPARRG